MLEKLREKSRAMATVLQTLNLAQRKDSPAVVDLTLIAQHQTTTYEALDKEVRNVQRVLQEAYGVSKGDTVGIALPNGLEFVVTFLAVGALGAVAAPLNPVYRESEFQFYMEDAKVKLGVVSTEGGNPAMEAVAEKLKVPIIAVSCRSGTTELTLKSGKQPEGCATTTVAECSDVCLLLHTSGTTSRPKAVPLTHANLSSSIENIAQTYELEAEDAGYLVMPLFHVHGLMCGLLAALYAGSTVCIPKGGRFSASSFWSDVVAHKVSWYTAVPTIHQVLLLRAKSDYPKDNPPKLRFIRSCSSALAPNLLTEIEAAFHTPVLEAYAMTEAAHQMCSNPLPKNGKRKPGTVGIGQGVEVAILDEAGNHLKQGEVGEVCVRGENVTSGYLNNPEANEASFTSDRWFRTGDQGFKDEEGYVTLVGRIKELINRGGEKISPLEIDAVLLLHEGVGEAVSFAVPDSKYGEEVNAAVVLKKECAQSTPVDEAALKDFCRKHLSDFKIPKKFFFAESLPKTATGKIQRRHVAAHFLEKA